MESPNKIFTLGTFCEMFGAAKSTLSEDIDILRGVFAQFHLGQLDTVTGAAGGVRYRPVFAPEDAYRTVKDLAQMLAAPGRVLPGGFIYMADILAMPEVVERMGVIIASQFYRAEPDFVLTMETKGHSDCDDDGAGAGRADGHRPQGQQGIRGPGGEHQLSLRLGQPGGRR